MNGMKVSIVSSELNQWTLTVYIFTAGGQAEPRLHYGQVRLGDAQGGQCSVRLPADCSGTIHFFGFGDIYAVHSNMSYLI